MKAEDNRTMKTTNYELSIREEDGKTRIFVTYWGESDVRAKFTDFSGLMKFATELGTLDAALAQAAKGIEQLQQRKAKEAAGWSPLFTQLEPTPSPTCFTCGGKMRQGIAIAPTWIGSPDFPGDTGMEAGCTMTQGSGEMMGVTKCKDCGRSFSSGPLSKAAQP